MEEYTNKELSLLFKSLDEKFKEAKEYIAGVINDGNNRTHTRLDTLNHSVAKNVNKIEKNKEWIIKSEDRLKSLWTDRENKFKRYGDLIWKIITIATLLFLGGNQLLDKL